MVGFPGKYTTAVLGFYISGAALYCWIVSVLGRVDRLDVYRVGCPSMNTLVANGDSAETKLHVYVMAALPVDTLPNPSAKRRDIAAGQRGQFNGESAAKA